MNWGTRGICSRHGLARYPRFHLYTPNQHAVQRFQSHMLICLAQTGEERRKESQRGDMKTCKLASCWSVLVRHERSMKPGPKKRTVLDRHESSAYRLYRLPPT